MDKYKPIIRLESPGEIGQMIMWVCRRMIDRQVITRDVSLMVGTCAMESHFAHRVQFDDGPARGLFQMEPYTAYDIFLNYLSYKPGRFWELMSLWLGYDCARYPSEPFALSWFIPSYDDLAWHLEHNDVFAAAMARLHYLRDPSPIPGTVEAQAAYWHRVYQTPQGSGKPDDYMRAWEEVGQRVFDGLDWRENHGNTI